MKIYLRLLPLLLGFFIFLINCAGGLVTKVKSNETKIAPKEGFQVFIDKGLGDNDEDSKMALNLFEINLLEKLKTSKKYIFYNSTEKCSPACKYKLDILFSKFKQVTVMQRALVGALAGRAELEGTGKVIESKTSTILAEFKLEEISSGGTAFAGTSRDVTAASGTRVGEYILKELGE